MSKLICFIFIYFIMIVVTLVFFQKKILNVEGKFKKKYTILVHIFYSLVWPYSYIMATITSIYNKMNR